MRIAMIGHKRVPSREGGIEVVVGELSSRMAALGHEVTLYSRRGRVDLDEAYCDPELGRNGAYDRPYTWKGVRVRPVKTIQAKGFAALSSSFFATLRAIRKRPDVIHYHAEGPCVPLLLARLAGIRTVATIHGLDWQRAKWGRFASAYIKLGEWVAARFADEVIVLSRNIQRYFSDTYGRETLYIPNGAEPKAPRAACEISRRWGLTKGSYLLFLGRIVPEKGVHYLVDAFRALDTDKRLVIAGGDMDSEEYSEKIRRRIAGDGRVIMTGFVQGEVLEELYSNAYLYVLPSDVEGMPLSLLEAMTYGRVCVTSDIPECDEVLVGHGAMFSRGSVASLYKTLKRLLESEGAFEEMERETAEHVLATYDWDKVVEQTLKAYAMAGGRKRACGHAGLRRRGLTGADTEELLG